MTRKLSQPFRPSSLGTRLADARRKLGVREGQDVTVPDLAERIGVTAASVYTWEADTAIPGERNLARVAVLLGVTEAYLRYGVENIPKSVIEGERKPEQFVKPNRKNKDVG